MSVPSLLRYVGVSVPRGVTVNGRVLTGSAATTAIATGRAVPVARHTFHGGVAELDRPTSRASWWTADPTAREADIVAVSAAFPGFTYDSTRGGHTFEGVIDTGRGSFVVAVSNRPDRHDLPRVIPVTPRALGRHQSGRFVRPKHMFTNGMLCVAADDDWEPEIHTSATVIAWAAHWYAVYTDWRVGGPWPSDGFHPRG